MAASRIRRLITRLRDLLNLPATVQATARQNHEELRSLRVALKSQAHRLDIIKARQSKQYGHIEHEVRGLHDEVRDRLLQYHLQLGRLASLIEGRTAEPQSYSARIPFTVEPRPAAGPLPPVDGEWLELSRCQGCGTAERTLVCEWNKSILADEPPQDDSTVSNFALCHGCGIVYATRRPVGERHRALMDDFPTTIGRDPAAAAADGLLNPFPLSDEDRARYRRMIAGGIFVSDHERRREHLSQVFRDRLENASHVELLGSLLDVHGARALEQCGEQPVLVAREIEPVPAIADAVAVGIVTDVDGRSVRLRAEDQALLEIIDVGARRLTEQPSHDPLGVAHDEHREQGQEDDEVEGRDPFQVSLPPRCGTAAA